MPRNCVLWAENGLPATTALWLGEKKTTKKTSRAPGVQSLNGSVEGNLAQKRWKESVWTFPRGQHWHFQETNFIASVDSMLGAARLKEWGDARGNMDIRQGITTTSKHHRGRIQVNNYSSSLVLKFGWTVPVLLILTLCCPVYTWNFHPGVGNNELQ